MKIYYTILVQPEDNGSQILCFFIYYFPLQ